MKTIVIYTSIIVQNENGLTMNFNTFMMASEQWSTSLYLYVELRLIVAYTLTLCHEAHTYIFIKNSRYWPSRRI